jgi:PHD/YefM family antitoxin component YafN of YafNO toxin-antitoxin module
MKRVFVSEARAKLYWLLDEAATSHEPIQIPGKRNSAVLVSEDERLAKRERGRMTP